MNHTFYCKTKLKYTDFCLRLKQLKNYYPMTKGKSIFWWIFAVIFTIAIAYYQRVTGPTYPRRTTVTINHVKMNFKLLRSQGDGDANIKLVVPQNEIEGQVIFKRFKSFDSLTTVEKKRDGEYLTASLPHQPPAGKIEYRVILSSVSEKVNLTAEPVVVRFKGEVPAYVLIPHILLMFLAMLFSTRTGIEALLKGTKTLSYTLWTVILLFLGGIVLGPFVQYYAFGAYWTGWPYGYDLTDNKTLIAFIFWVIALFVLFKRPANRFWPIFASVVLLLVYLIPHSVLGSEIDHTKAPKI